MKRLPKSDLEHVLDHTRELWEELRGESIFITGGTGFFGKWLLESFLWANDRLNLKSHSTILTRSPDSFRDRVPHLAEHKSVTLLQGDVGTFDLRIGKFNHIIHAATYAQSFSAPLNALDMFTENVQGTYHVLDFAETCQAKKLLFTSSGAVYGKQPAEIAHVSEDYSGAPDTTAIRTAYGQSKRASEFLCVAAAQSGLQAKIARCFTFAGPHLSLDTNYAIGNFIRDALNGNDINIQGDGTPYRSYLYAADLAIWLWTILFRGEPARPYNVGSDADLTVAQLAVEITRNLGPQLEVRIMKEPALNEPPQRYTPCIKRAKDELDLDVYIELPEAILRMAKFYSQ
jgi:nucleoside-diphosphate-sugar epimerase